MNSEIIAVGSELLLGQIVNSNAQYLSKQLAEIGINVFYHTTVGDNSDRLKKSIEIARTRADLIIFTGGLGPTKDDLTKETIAAMSGKKLVYDETSIGRIKQYFKQTGRIMTENNKKQALVIEGSSILLNDCGMAPGMAFKDDKHIFMLLPGPPNEMKPMFESYARSFLEGLLERKERIESTVLRFYGIGESSLETEIIDLIENQTNPTIAPLAANGEVTLRLTAKHESAQVANELLKQTEEDILSRVGEYFYGYDNTSLAESVFFLLQSNDLTITTAESLTGGKFVELITNFSGASKVINGGIVCYTNEAKIKMVNVSPSTIQTYGAVSKECAAELADNIRSVLSSDIGMSFTGVAGPSKSEGKDVGTVYIGLSTSETETKVFELKLAGSRDSIRMRSVKYGFFYLLKYLKNNFKN